MPYRDLDARRAKDRRYYAAHRLDVLARKRRPTREGLPIGVNKRLNSHPDRRMAGSTAAVLHWALVEHQYRHAPDLIEEHI